MTPADFLRSKGWHTWYSEKYWVHPDSIDDPKRQDYTDYGMCLEDALKYEKLGKPKHAPMGIPIISQMFMAKDTKGLSQKP